MINSVPDYPKGSTDDMEYIERTSLTSLYLFSGLPFLYFRGYAIAITNAVDNNGEKETFYNDTLEVLNKMEEAANRCLARPALAVWEEKQETIYQAQQIQCSAYLNFAEEVYFLEQQRLEIDQNCTVPLKECAEHQEIFNKIRQLASDMFDQIDSAPAI